MHPALHIVYLQAVAIIDKEKDLLIADVHTSMLHSTDKRLHFRITEQSWL